MHNQVKSKDAVAVINALMAGVVPDNGIQHITVGREKEIKAILQAIEEVKNGQSHFKFWLGDYGSGKSFMLKLLENLGLQLDFVVTGADFNPNIRLYARDGKALSLYRLLIKNLRIKTIYGGNALIGILDLWLEKQLKELAHNLSVPYSEIRKEQYKSLIYDGIQNRILEISDTIGFDLSKVMIQYYDGVLMGNYKLMNLALKWMKGEFHTKTESRKALGVGMIINDENYFSILNAWGKIFLQAGFKGFMINLDEAVNLFRIHYSGIRMKNYEMILSFYNDCYQGRVSNLFINLAGTPEFFDHPVKGLFSYEAIKTRLKFSALDESTHQIYSQPVIRLLPLSHEEIFVLLRKAEAIFKVCYALEFDISNESLEKFMQRWFEKDGHRDLITPREILREFLMLLTIIKENPHQDFKTLIQLHQPVKANFYSNSRIDIF